MSERWKVASATQITRSGAAMPGPLATQIADHIGGSARGYLADLSLISVSAIMRIHGMIASVACIFIQAIVPYERAHMPRIGAQASHSALTEPWLASVNSADRILRTSTQLRRAR
jgi:hypothetical protein